MNKTEIPWTDFTWTVSRGCSPVSAGCDNCYAAATACSPFLGMNKPGGPYEGLAKDGKWTGRIELCPQNLDEPLKRKKPARIFVNSMSDLFHMNITDDYLDRIFGVMWACLYGGRYLDGLPGHTFQLLTKRPEWMREYMSASRYTRWATEAANLCENGDSIYDMVSYRSAKGPHPRIWAGATVENQKQFDERVIHLVNTPAAIRFISIEPMLSPIDISYMPLNQSFDGFGGPVGSKRYLDYIDWVIVGCESGPGARPCNLDWIRDIRDQCVAAGVPLFIKQARIDGKLVKMPEIEGVIYNQYPERGNR